MICGFCLWFNFPSDSLIFTPNLGLYIPMSPCSSPNSLLFTQILSYGFVPLSSVPYVLRGGTRGGGEWVSSCSCARYNFGAKHLLRQYQSQAWHPVWILVLQGTWGSCSMKNPGVQPCVCNLNPSFNPSFDVQNRFVYFCVLPSIP